MTEKTGAIHEAYLLCQKTFDVSQTPDEARINPDEILLKNGEWLEFDFSCKWLVKVLPDVYTIWIS